MKPVYFDYNATAPVKGAVQGCMLSCLQEYGNPSSTHRAGRMAKVALDRARDQLAQALDATAPEEFVFTSSGTEATNMALKGSYFYAKGKVFHILTSPTEHKATLEASHFLKNLGAQVHHLQVDKEGQINLRELEEKLRSLYSPKHSVLVSLMAANNETGLIFPYQKIGSLCKEYNAQFHLDGVQAPGKIPFSIRNSKADLVSLSAHKIGGPKGVGALFLRKGTSLVSLIHGGTQERNRRAGTQNVPGIAGFGQAASLLQKVSLEEIKKKRDYLEEKICAKINGVTVVSQKQLRLTNTSHLLFTKIKGDSLLMGLDLEGFAVSTGSACTSGATNPSHVLLAMGYTKEEANSAIRVSLGPENTKEEIERFINVLPSLASRMGSASK